jgi:tetratricopeptide (TPR) repeat protein
LASGNYPRALAIADAVGQYARQHGDAAGEAAALNLQGRAYAYQALYPQAIAAFQDSIRKQQGTGDVKARINLLTNLGVAYHYTGQYGQALQTYEQALGLAKANAAVAGVPRLEQLAAINLATLYQRLGQNAKALGVYSQYRGAAGTLSPSEEARALSNQGALYRRLGDPYKALEAYAKARALFQDQRNARGELTTALNVAIAEGFGLGRPAAQARFAEVDQRAATMGDRTKAVQARLYGAEFARRRGQAALARTMFASALEEAQAVGLVEEVWKAELGLGQAAEALGDAAAAMAHYDRAITRIEDVRARLLAPALTAGFLADKGVAYDRRLALEIAGAGHGEWVPEATVDRLLDWISRRQARVFDDRLRASLNTPAAATGRMNRMRQLRDAMAKKAGDTTAQQAEFARLEAEQFGGPAAVSRTGLRRIQQQLRREEAAAVVWLGEERGAVIWITPAAYGVHWLESAAAMRAATALRRDVTRPGAPWAEAAAAVEKLLWATAPREAKSWHLVMDAPLAGVPMEVLERFAGVGVTYHPSLYELLRPGDRVRGVVWPWEERGLVLAYSPAGEAGGMGDRLAPLPQAVAEAQDAARSLAGPVTLLVGDAATEAALADGLETAPRYLHVAAHAQTNYAEPDSSRLVLAPGREGEGSLFLSEIYGWRLQGVRLVTLSACGTAEGRNTAGEGVEALSQAFLAGGAESVVASLWPVDDRATRVFMQRFYAALADGAAPAEALQRVKQEFRAAGTELSHPFYWAAFVVHGGRGVGGAYVVSWTQGWLALAVALAVAGVAFTLRQRRTER